MEKNCTKQRIEKRILYLKEKRNNELKFSRQSQKFIAQQDYFISLIDFLFNKGGLFEAAVTYNSAEITLIEAKEFNENSFYEWHLKALKDLKQGKGEYIIPELKQTILKNPSFIPEIARYSIRKTKKLFEKKALQARLNYENCFVNLFSSIDDLVKMKDNSLFEFIDKEIKENFDKALQRVIEAVKNPAQSVIYGESENWEKRINDSMTEFTSISNNYKNALKSYKPSMRKKAEETARLNVRCLEEEIGNFQKNKAEYFNTLEGSLLAFCTFQLETRQSKENEDYSKFLNEKADEKLSVLQDSKIEEVITNLNNLRKNGYVSDNDYILMHKILEKKFKSDENLESKVDKENFEDVQLRALVISDYEISSTEAIRIAKLTKNEDMDRTIKELSLRIDSEIAPLLIRDNPEIFFMDNTETERYITRLKEVMNLTSRYYTIDDFNPIKSPHNFSSFDALKNTRRKLHDMVQNTSLNLGNQDRTDNGINEIERIKLELARDGFDPDFAWAILQRGFYFKSEYFAGDHRINREHLEKNTRKDSDINFDNRRFNKELRKLISSGAVLYNRGYSINHKTRELKINSLERAIGYILTHHPLEND